MSENICIKTPKDMQRLGRAMSEKACSGMVIALTGGLGAGKTTFVKGLAAGLGILDEITSPSFTIIKEYYDGRLPLYHMDLYRIDSTEDLVMIGFDEFIYGKGVSVIEWSEKAGECLPDYAVRMCIDINSDSSRTVSITGLNI